MSKFSLTVATVFSLAGSLAIAQNPNAPTGEIQVLKVQGNVYMLQGAGGNVVVQVGDMGVVVVDTGLAQNADKLLTAVRKLSDKPIQYVVNTHMHSDHTGGNDAVRKAGQRHQKGSLKPFTKA